MTLLLGLGLFLIFIFLNYQLFYKYFLLKSKKSNKSQIYSHTPQKIRKNLMDKDWM